MEQKDTEPEVAPSLLGDKIRQVRTSHKMSLRELARRIGVSPSFISQVELGRAQPSIGTLLAIAGELRISLDALMAGAALAEVAGVEDGSAPGADSKVTNLVGRDTQASPAYLRPGDDDQVGDHRIQRAENRQRLQAGMVTWELLTPQEDPQVEFLRITYAAGSESCPPNDLMTHGGWEYGHVVQGQLSLQIGFTHYELCPGDSINFDSAVPHRLSNPRAEDCIAVWIVVDRRNRSSAVHDTLST